MTSDPAGRRRDCVEPCFRASHPAMRGKFGARRPAEIDVLSAPVLRFGFRRILEYQPFEVGCDAAMFFRGAQNQ